MFRDLKDRFPRFEILAALGISPKDPAVEDLKQALLKFAASPWLDKLRENLSPHESIRIGTAWGYEGNFPEQQPSELRRLVLMRDGFRVTADSASYRSFPKPLSFGRDRVKESHLRAFLRTNPGFTGLHCEEALREESRNLQEIGDTFQALGIDCTCDFLFRRLPDGRTSGFCKKDEVGIRFFTGRPSEDRAVQKVADDFNLKISQRECSGISQISGPLIEDNLRVATGLNLAINILRNVRKSPFHKPRTLILEDQTDERGIQSNLIFISKIAIEDVSAVTKALNQILGESGEAVHLNGGKYEDPSIEVRIPTAVSTPRLIKKVLDVIEPLASMQRKKDLYYHTR